MGSIVSMHIFLEEHLHPAIHMATGNICSTLTTGWAFMMGSALFAVGSAMYYTSGVAPHEGVFDRYEDWPPYVSSRVRSTYIYFSSALVICAISMASVCQSPNAMAFLSQYTLGTVLWSVLAMFLTGDIARAIPYSGSPFGTKQIAFAIHSATMGVILAPVCLLGGTVMLQAGWLTAGVVSLASVLSIFAPSYWIMGVSLPLSFCYLTAFVSSITGIIWPTYTTMGAHSYGINLYVGVVAMAGFLLFYSHFFFLVAERIPDNDTTIYDPMSASILIFRYTLDVFMRIAILLVGGGNGVFKLVCTFAGTPSIPKG